MGVATRFRIQQDRIGYRGVCFVYDHVVSGFRICWDRVELFFVSRQNRDIVCKAKHDSFHPDCRLLRLDAKVTLKENNQRHYLLETGKDVQCITSMIICRIPRENSENRQQITFSKNSFLK